MKISQIVITLLVVLFGGTVVMSSMDQKKVMTLLTTTHGGGQQVADPDATGLRKANQELDAEAARAAGERAEAIKVTENARVEMRDHRDKRNDTKADLDNDKEKLSDTQKKVDEAKERVEKIRKSFIQALQDLKTTSRLDFDPEGNISDVMEAIKQAVKDEKERAEKLTADLERETASREAHVEKLAKEKVELARLNGINDRFFKNYMHNSDEFPILVAEPHWRFVVFKANADSGLVAGDSTPMLIKRGSQIITPVRIISIKNGLVIAEFDPEKLENGMRPQVGDTAFRKKPLGH